MKKNIKDTYSNVYKTYINGNRSDFKEAVLKMNKKNLIGFIIWIKNSTNSDINFIGLMGEILNKEN